MGFNELLFYFSDHKCFWLEDPFAEIPVPCAKKFSSSRELNEHVYEIHFKMQTADIRCCWANCRRKMQEFSTRNYLRYHLRSHTDYKPFTCPYDNCELNFAWKEDLNKHVRSDHSFSGNVSSLIDSK